MARKKGGHAAGGHGWFVTFADLMALMMSFFVMLTAFSTQDAKKLNAVAGSMRDAFGQNKDSRRAGIIEVDGIPTRPHLKNVERVSPDQGSEVTAPVRSEKRTEGLQIALYERTFALAAASLRQAMQDMPELTEVSRNVIFQETPDGLNIEIVDQDGRSMFAEGAVRPYERTKKLLEAMAPHLRKLPNRLKVSGHTSVTRGGSARPGSRAWELSTERALAVRDLLAESGLPDNRFSAVVGKADTEPLFPDDPSIAANRRITILLMREAPPLPAGLRP